MVINGVTLKVNYSKYKTIDLSRNNKNMNSINFNEVLLVPSPMNRYNELGIETIKELSKVIEVKANSSDKLKSIDLYLLTEQIAKPINIKISNESDQCKDKLTTMELTYNSAEEAAIVVMKLHSRQIADSKIIVNFK